jgi:predicted lipoprotein with Yx(FWY)xxD motif
MTFNSVSLLLVSSFFAISVQAQPVMQPAAQGGILTDPAGITLYTYDPDKGDKIICQGSCLQAWPAYTAEPVAGEVLVSQASRLKGAGKQQWAWNGKPLYYFIGDSKPGDRIGDGSADVWHIVKP